MQKPKYKSAVKRILVQKHNITFDEVLELPTKERDRLLDDAYKLAKRGEAKWKNE